MANAPLVRPGRAENDQALKLMVRHPLAPDNPEGESPVQRRVRDRGKQQPREVGALGAQRIAQQQQEQAQVRHGAGHPDGGEAHQLTDQRTS
jgi:hypothetical protein